MKPERTDRKRNSSRASKRSGDAPPLTGEPDLSQLSDIELLRRLARLRPERYGAAFRETMAIVRLMRSKDIS